MFRFPARRLLLLAVMLCVQAAHLGALPAADGSGETEAQRDARMQWWREARFGMFVHWGLYCVPAGTWKGQATPIDNAHIMRSMKIPVAEYSALAARFNPVDFDAEKLALLAKAAGMKYVVFTAKHHEGFAMFHSVVSPYNIYDATPFKRDPVAELAAACRKHGLKLGLYYSHARDWYHPGGSWGKDGKTKPWDPALEGDMDHYLDTVAIPQAKELLSRYGDIAVIWWDTPDNMTPARVKRLEAVLALQPGIISNDRWGAGFRGDYRTSEQFVPGAAEQRDWEACMTINRSWAYNENDRDWKSASQLVQILIDTASKGGNYLLDVGPDARGNVQPEAIERLRGMGEWLRRNGEAVYDTGAGPFRYLAWGRATQKPGRLFLHVFDWPKDGRLLVPVAGGIKRVYPLGRPDENLATKATKAGVEIAVPAQGWDPVVSVMVAEVEGPLVAVRQGISAGDDGRFTLGAGNGVPHGLHIRVQGGDVVEWRSGYYMTWPIYVETPGRYRLEVTYATRDATADPAGFQFLLENAKLAATLPPTKSPADFSTIIVGEIDATAAGTCLLKWEALRGAVPSVIFQKLTLTRR